MEKTESCRAARPECLAMFVGGCGELLLQSWWLAAAPQASLRPPNGGAAGRLENLAAEVHRFLRQLPGLLPRVAWEEVLSEKAVTYTGEEVYTAERLHWDRVAEALPPADACAAVDAAEVSEGIVRECLLHPEFIMKEAAGRGPRPRTPRVWAIRAT